MSQEAAMIYLRKGKTEVQPAMPEGEQARVCRASHNPNDCQRKRSWRQLYIIIGIFFVIGVIAIGYLFWLYYGWF